jgi:hypothetical protein
MAQPQVEMKEMASGMKDTCRYNEKELQPAVKGKSSGLTCYCKFPTFYKGLHWALALDRLIEDQ